MSAANRLEIDGRLASRDALRHTPAGIPIVSFAVAHRSTQREAGEDRQVDVEIACVAVEELARLVSAGAIGAAVRVAGFLAPRGRSSRQTVLHVNDIEFLNATE